MNLLAIFAHPDDESFSCGGTLAKAAADGHKVDLICATRGEEGEIVHPDIDPEAYPKGDARGELRTRELEATCQALGINLPIWLNHHDSGFPIEVGLNNPKAFMNQEIVALERQLLPLIADTQPDVIITFDPHGGYPHIDHITIHRAATSAFWSVGSIMTPAPRRLFYPARSLEVLREIKANSTSTTMADVDPELYGVSQDSVAATIDIRPFADQKREAIMAHGSQFGTREKIQAMLDGRAGMLEQELFVLGGLRGSFPAMPLTDLFTGL
ncbi:MAG: PIG-L deacetylase family protein [Deinococcota bacterium]